MPVYMRFSLAERNVFTVPKDEMMRMRSYLLDVASEANFLKQQKAKLEGQVA